MDNSRPSEDTETKECLRWKDKEPVDNEMLISNRGNGGNKFICETASLEQGKEDRREISQLIKQPASRGKGRQNLENPVEKERGLGKKQWGRQT